MLRLDINLVFTIVNLLILYVLVRRFLFKPIHRILEERQAQIDKQYEDARSAQEKAEELKRQYEDSLNKITEEKTTIINEARSKASKEYEKILEEAKGQADQITEDAARDAEAEWQKSRRQAQEQIADLVVAATAKIVASRQNAEADRELYNQFLAKTGEKFE